MKKWTIQTSEYLVSDRWLKLRVDSCLSQEGKLIEPFYILEYKDWVNCLVIDRDLNVLLVRHYRHGVQNEILEIIGGAVEKSDSSIKSGIKRELEEELGYVGGEIFQTGISYSNPASQTNKVYSFLAVGGSIKVEQTLEEGENLTIEKIKFIDFFELLDKDEEIFQSMHIANIFFAFTFIKKNDSIALSALKEMLLQSN